ncbi:L-seryl-tRNA(Sec) kinase isoform X1 [Hydra vulgaris]|uniref:L-seryl-tRNA(Sec) kinase isoform X1 n=1 Tax=Hydra vulgaris TaxID=6087 RepID=UPI001F5FF137|nr:L-seryl-tRNA(Sec) kinase [Hydra vulgaris]
MTDSSKGLCLCILMGLPASGKTSLIKQLKAYYSKSDFVHMISITYDDYLSFKIKDHSISDDIEDFYKMTLTLTLTTVPLTITNDACSKNLTWKEKRQNVLKLVESFVLFLLGISQPYIALHAEKSLELCSCFNHEYSFLSNKSHVIFIDDNMYYRSMRYSYYQLARHFKISYCQIYLKVKLEDALKRNADRENSVVTSETIYKMSSLFEEPDLMMNHWEKHTLCLNGDYNDESLNNIVNFIDDSFHYTAQFLNSNDQVISTCSKIENLKNCYHQVDILLRKYITIEMNRIKINSNETSFSNHGKTLNDKRKLFFNALKSNEGFYNCSGFFINLNEVAGDVLTGTFEEEIVKAFLNFNVEQNL